MGIPSGEELLESLRAGGSVLRKRGLPDANENWQAQSNSG